MGDNRATPFDLSDPDRLLRIRDVFDAAGYDDAGVAQLLGDDLPPRLGAARIPVLMRRTAGGTPLEALVRLFVLGVATTPEEIERTLAPAPPEDWVGLGLLAAAGDGTLWPTVQIRCYRKLRVASDLGRERVGLQLPADFVMAISPSTLSLAGVTVRRPVKAALDLGCGAGFQAFLAAEHSERVVAVDRNPRAVATGLFNQAFNGLDNVDFREGDLFEPVAGEKFDLIVSNPPFVLAPAFRYFYLHSGLPRDEISRTIVRTAPEFLEEGGLCQLWANWIVGAGEAWSDPIVRWVEGTGCDALVLSKGPETAGAYAADWVQPVSEDPAALAESVEEALASFETEGIEALAKGLVTLRRRSAGPNWFHADTLPERMAFPCGDDVQRAIDVQDAFSVFSDDRALLECRFEVAPDVRLVEQREVRDRRWTAVDAELQRTEGLMWQGRIDEHGARLLAGCDGATPLGQLLHALADAAGIDPDAAVSRSLPVVRRLLEQGFLRADLSAVNRGRRQPPG